jgi:hypothetical protein
MNNLERLTFRECERAQTLLAAAGFDVTIATLTTQSPLEIAANLGGANKRARRTIAELLDLARDDDGYLHEHAS